MPITAEKLKELLIEHDDGILKTGSHKPGGRDFCAMEFLAKVAGEPWTDNPKCVNRVLAAYCRRLNDSEWPSDEARTETMLPLLAAVFGTSHLKIDVKRIAEQTIRLIVPEAMEAAAKVNPKHADKLRAAGKRCADEGTKESAQAARKAGRDAADAAYDAAAYAAYAADAAYAAAADAAAYAAAAADAAAYAADAAYAAYAADAAERIRLYKISISIVMAEIERAKAEV